MTDEDFVPAVSEEQLMAAQEHLNCFFDSLGFCANADSIRRHTKYWAGLLENQREAIHASCFETKLIPGEEISIGPIRFSSVCSHHYLPFFGNAWVKYSPNGRVLGLSKFARMLRGLSSKPWIQEDLTDAFAGELDLTLRPDWIEVRTVAKHLCLISRGVETPETEMTCVARRP